MLARFLVFIFFPICCLAGYFSMHIFRSLPDTEGERYISGISDSVEIVRDQYGMVNISAKTDNDVFFALGFAHAQDRFWQMEVQRRIAQGRLSELFGKQSVESDILFRTLDLYEAGSKSLDGLTPDAKKSLESYALGVNAWLGSKSVLPPEFIFFDIKPEVWKVEDSLATIKLFALTLSGTYLKDMSRFIVKNMVSAPEYEALFGTEVNAKLVNNNESLLSETGIEKFLLAQHKLQSDLSLGGEGVGSNAWVVSGKHGNNSYSLLCNDPHLRLQIPGNWYAARLKGEKINSVGMTLVGLPVVILGRNEDIAWAATNMMTDNQDLFFEQINTDDKNKYKLDGEWKSFDLRKEVINIKADFPSSLRKPLKPIELTVRTTDRGPIISDLYKDFDQPISLSWTALSEDDYSYNSFYELNFANSWESYKKALRQLVAPNLNMLYADRKGNIGYLGAGRIPLRKNGNGTLPVPAWIEGSGWDGFVPPEEWPEIYNPAEGFIVSANDNILPAGYPYYVTSDWSSPYRAKRIRQLLKDKIESTQSKLTFQDMADIQADTISLPAKDLLPFLLTTSTEDKRLQRVINILKNWDGDMSVESTAATIFHHWAKNLRTDVFMDNFDLTWSEKGKRQFIGLLIDKMPINNMLASLNTDGDIWCDDTSTSISEDCQDILVKSLTRTVRELTKLQGHEFSDWAWGDVHKTAYRHTPFSEIKLFDLFFERNISNGGSFDTVNVSGAKYYKSIGYRQGFGAALRQNIAIKQDSVTHHYMLPTGQSGNVLSKNYDDMIKSFNSIEFISVDQVTNEKRRLTLLPTKRRSVGG